MTLLFSLFFTFCQKFHLRSGTIEAIVCSRTLIFVIQFLIQVFSTKIEGIFHTNSDLMTDSFTQFLLSITVFDRKVLEIVVQIVEYFKLQESIQTQNFNLCQHLKAFYRIYIKILYSSQQKLF